MAKINREIFTINVESPIEIKAKSLLQSYKKTKKVHLSFGIDIYCNFDIFPNVVNNQITRICTACHSCQTRNFLSNCWHGGALIFLQSSKQKHCWENCHCPSLSLPVPSLHDVLVCSQAESKGRSPDKAMQDLVLCFFIENSYFFFWEVSHWWL